MTRFVTPFSLCLLTTAANAQLILPYAGTDSSATISSFQITKSGTSGRANTLYISNASNTSDALLVNTVGTGRAAYLSINNAGSMGQALRADSNGSGISVFGFMTGSGRAGSFRITNANSSNAALSAQTNGSGPVLLVSAGTGLAGDFQGNVRTSGSAEIQGALSVGAGPNPAFPLDFSEALGEKIALWGNDPNANYGLGVQDYLLQIHSDVSDGAVAIGYGSSTNFKARVTFSGVAQMTFLKGDDGHPVDIRTPHDLVLTKDFAQAHLGSWFRLFTGGDSALVEQVRIDDGDEASSLFDGTVVANGIDFAEAFKVLDSSLEPGDLVVNHRLDWQVIAKPDHAYDEGLIGVVSTKPAFVAGMSFDAEDKIDPELTRERDLARQQGDQELEKHLTQRMRQMVNQAYRPVAFMGRVPVKVTGAVRVGDHLTASQVPGVAMAMTHAGQSVGIALEPNSGGFGKIMVMIQPGHYAGPNLNQGTERTLLILEKKVEALATENEALRIRLDRLERSFANR